MAATGTPFETPRACPFVALELDRDRRSDKPDYRHRCFAEPTPAPRSIAHQEAFCLSPNFAGCPVFQDWAVRAAARPTAAGARQLLARRGRRCRVAGSGQSPAHGAAPVERSLVGMTGPGRWSMPRRQNAAARSTSAPGYVSVEQLPRRNALRDCAGRAASPPPRPPRRARPRGSAASPPTFATTDWESESVTRASSWASSMRATRQSTQPQSSYGEPDAGYPSQRPAAAASIRAAAGATVAACDSGRAGRGRSGGAGVPRRPIVAADGAAT